MARFFKFILALVLLPTLVLGVAELVHLLGDVLGAWRTAGFFFGGAILYTVIHFAWYDFSRIYVFAHELTHALAALLCGYRVHKISVKKDNGFVKMDKTNTFVVLAPYFVPFYTLVFALGYASLGFFTNLEPYGDYMLAAVGFLTAFHIIQTFKTLWEADQPDLKLAGGKIFSLVTISLVNLLVLACVLKVLFPQTVDLTTAGLNVLRGTLNAWRIIVNYIVEKIINAL